MPVSRSSSRLTWPCLGLLAATPLACGDIEEVRVEGAGKRRTLWHCVADFERMVVRDNLVVHVCPPPGENTALDRWVGDAICDSELTISTEDGGGVTARASCPRDFPVRVDVIGQANLISLVDTTLREGELVLDARERLLPRTEYGGDGPMKYTPVVVLVRQRIRDIVAEEGSQVFVDGIREDGANNVRIQARDRAEVTVSGTANGLMLSVAERAVVNASALVVQDVELRALDDAWDSVDIGGRAAVHVCASGSITLSRDATDSCTSRTLHDALTTAVNLTACCAEALPAAPPTRAFRCGLAASQSECSTVPTCPTASTLSYSDCPR